jgi:hypothetical protein
MNEMIAFCGLDCGSCPIHLATLEQDKSQQYAMRESIAEQLSKYYGTDSQPGDINDCDGCRPNTGRIFTGCLQCGIRQCANLKNLESCALCADYSCDKLKKHFLLDPAAQSRLEKIQKAN